MGYENDTYRDEDGEPLMDPLNDDVLSDQEPLMDPLDDDDDVDVGGDDWRRRERSPTPVFNESESKSKPRKRLIKKSTPVEDDAGVGVGDYEDDDVATAGAIVRDDLSDGGYPSSSGGGKRKKFGKDGSGKKREKKMKSDKGSGGSKFKVRSEKGGRPAAAYAEEQEMWNTVAGGDSEDDQEGLRMVDDDNFIDDTGVDPADRYGSDHEPRSPGDAPQAEEGEEDDEITELFKMGKKKKKNEKSAADISILVENVMAELEVVAEEDAELNRQSKPAINKLRKLPLLTEVLSKVPLKYPIDLEQYDRREQLKKSGLGKVIMFLSKSDEETTSNRKLAKDLVDKWSRPIFKKSTRFEDMRNYDDETVPFRRPSAKKPMSKAAGMQSRDDDLDLAEFSQEPKSSQSSSRQHASRPEAMPLDFRVRPQSKIDPDEIRARAKQVVQDQRRMKMNRKLQQLKAPKKRQLQATKLSVEGRGMVKYL
ncbi:hypothetical protein RJ639_024283 [Escallonia herrerae]|uniref:TFIIS N-terminal domain-containing protein n=1 Tax=Escallonia herrerae TaxID=1293975 RepID=A0AA88V1A6_9ASTE|nr:hypothetical protein RJ639_024283 [Escallonia herrerae]